MTRMSEEVNPHVEEPAEEVPENAASPSENGRQPEITLEEQLVAAQAEAAKNLDGWQRSVAELSNARKRFDKQTQQAFTNATIDVVGKLLPIQDDFERALANVPEEIAENPWFDGFNGIMRKLSNILENINAERIPSVGEPFDPNIHDAISSAPSDEHESGVVMDELQAGYRIGERVIRPALVVVAA